ncbi:hypothetical protein CRYUN_Cryun18bG0124900 [Craigia yunnanensis]
MQKLPQAALMNRPRSKKLSEEEFGLSSHDPIMLPCNSALLEYIVFIVQQVLDKHLEKARSVLFLLVATVKER